jgi:hypothetical protein
MSRATLNIVVLCHLGNCSCVTYYIPEVMALRHTVDVQGCTNALKDRMSEKGHPEHRRSLPSMALRHTVHPEHKKALRAYALKAF